MKDRELTLEQQAMANEIEDLLTTKLRAEVKTIARLLASKDNHELFGETEFQLRDLLMSFGAQSLDAALEARKKKTIKDPA
jgi:hypothetical protein